MYLQLQTKYVSVEDVYGWLHEIHFRWSGDHLETAPLRISFSTFKSNRFFCEYNGVKGVSPIGFERGIDHFFRKILSRTTFFVEMPIPEFGIKTIVTMNTAQNDPVL